jgi:hypothetical protein
MGLPREFPEVFDAIRELVDSRVQQDKEAEASDRRAELLRKAKGRG